MSTTDDLVNRIVRGVLETLQTPAVAVHSAPAVSTALSTPASTTKAVETSNELKLTQPVVTHELLEHSWKEQRRIVVSPKAVITPTARDFLKKRKLELVRSGTTTRSAESAKGSKESSESTATNRWRVFVVENHPQLDRVLEDISRSGSSRCEKSLPTSLPEAITSAITALARAEIVGGLLLTHQPLVAACRGNRTATIRAAAAAEVAGIREAKRQVGANLICFDPTGKSYFELRNLIRASIEGAAPATPKDWQD